MKFKVPFLIVKLEGFVRRKLCLIGVDDWVRGEAQWMPSSSTGETEASTATSVMAGLLAAERRGHGSAILFDG